MIELLLIVVIMPMIAMPSFTAMIRNNHQTNNRVGSLQLVRSSVDRLVMVCTQKYKRHEVGQR